MTFLSWWGILRLGLIQSALGALVFLPINTFNRVLVVEFAFAAVLPGFLITLHHSVQLARPRIGYGSDLGDRRTPWIMGGMFILAAGSITSALGVTLMPVKFPLGISVAVLGYLLIGLGSGAAGTSLLVLLSKQVVDHRKPAAASLVWFMMITTNTYSGKATEMMAMPRKRST